MESVQNIRMRRSKTSMLNSNKEFLKNGYIKRGKKSVQTINACAFDAIYHSFAALYADYKHVRSNIDVLSHTCAFLSLVRSMFNKSGYLLQRSNILYKERNILLHQLFTQRAEVHDNGFIHINCEINVNELCEKLLPPDCYSFSTKK